MSEQKQSLPRIEISEMFNAELKSLKSKLKDRDVKDFSSEEFVDYLFNQADISVIQDFIEHKTPITYKLKALMNDETAKKDLEKFIQSYQNRPQKKVKPLESNELK